MADLLCCVAAIGLHLASAHVNPSPEATGLSNVNPGAYIEWKNGAVLGTYRNSIRKQSVYAGYVLHGPKWGPLQPALTVGVITGYYRSPLLAVVPSLYWDMGGAGVRVSYIPNVSYTKVHTLHLALERRF